MILTKSVLSTVVLTFRSSLQLTFVEVYKREAGLRIKDCVRRAVVVAVNRFHSDSAALPPPGAENEEACHPDLENMRFVVLVSFLAFSSNVRSYNYVSLHWQWLLYCNNISSTYAFQITFDIYILEYIHVVHGVFDNLI